jgi:uncharacterized protein (DUF736 family)
MSKKYALPIGTFTKAENGVYTGKLETLAIKANVSLIPNDDKEKDIHPDLIFMHGEREIGVAWNREDDRGAFVSLSPEEPSLTPGVYTMVKSGAEKGYTLYFRKYMPKKDKK